MTFKLFFIDMLKGTVLSLILFVPLIMGLFLFIDKTGDLWWIYAFLFFAGFQFLVSLLYPLVIAPLFNKFSPLEEGSLKDKLEALAEKTSFKTKGIFQMDGSRRSAHSNAYFTGFGRAKRIVLFDTLIKKLNDDELEAVLAHEIGHYKKKHILKSMISSLVISLGLFYLLSQLLHYDPLYQAFGFSEASPAVLLFLITILMEPISFFIKPLFSGFSRKNEYEADRYAKEITGSPNFLIKALTKLSKDNLSNLTPHKAFSAFHYSHPVLSERIAALESN